MKAVLFTLYLLACAVVGSLIGIALRGQTTCNPTPEQCVSVCVDIFEQMGC